MTETTQNLLVLTISSLFIHFLLLTSQSTPVLAEESPGCDVILGLQQEIENIRGLTFKKDVPCELKTKTDVRNYLVETFRSQVPIQKRLNEELLFKSLGLIPANYAYFEGILSMYEQQVGGYYDPKKETYSMAAWMPAGLQKPIAAHELVHGLQDQYYDLNTFMDPSYSTDKALARAALIEGDATAVMHDYTRGKMRNPSISTEKDVSSIIMQTIASTALNPELREVPYTIQSLALFPYISGLRYVHSFIKNYGYSHLDNLFRHPSEKTKYILHPELLSDIDDITVSELSCSKSKTIKFREISTGSLTLATKEREEEFSLIYEDSLGAFLLSIFLKLNFDFTEHESLTKTLGSDAACTYKSEGGRYLIQWNLGFSTDEAISKIGEILRSENLSGNKDPILLENTELCLESENIDVAQSVTTIQKIFIPCTRLPAAETKTT